MHFDTAAALRAREITLDQLDAIASMPTKKDQSELASLFGVRNLPFNPLMQTEVELPAIAPMDPLHSECIGITKLFYLAALK